MTEIQASAPLQENSKPSRRFNYLLYIGLIAIAVLIVEFLVSPLIQQRAQRQLLTQFSTLTAQAASAFGQSDVSPLMDTAPAYGSPVAIIEIPKIGLTQVVVEGASSSYTQTGPAHVQGTVLPGQAGESVIIGRRTTFGAPFYKINKLRVGDEIKLTTLEGPSVYKVIEPKSVATDANVLKLHTSNPPVLATSTITVVAQLQAQPYPLTPKNARELPNSGQFSSMVLLLLILLFVLRLSVGLFARFGPLIGWLLVVPVGVGALVALTLALDTLLPATI